MGSKINASDVFDVNKKTGALILGKNRLDDYAAKFLSALCKEAIETPMPLPVDKILNELGLTVKEEKLSKNGDIFGCCLLLDGEVEVYDEEKKAYTNKQYMAGTILIDPNTESTYGEGSKRNTLIHEAIHWEKDRTYFKVLSMRNRIASEKLYPIMCRQSDIFYEPSLGKKTRANEVKWLEWQAHRLAPRILMPKNSFKKKALELIDVYIKNNDESLLSCDLLIEDLSSFFKVSRTSVKYRIDEVGLKDVVSKFKDYESVFASINNCKNFVSLTPVEALNLLDAKPSLRNWVEEGRFIFVDGYFIIPDAKYITIKNDKLVLTQQAKKNLSRCALNIREQYLYEYNNFDKDIAECTYLYRSYDVDKKILLFHPNYQTHFDYDADEAYKEAAKFIENISIDEEMELINMIGDPRKTLCHCLWYLMEKKGWKYPEKFSEETHLHPNFHGRIKNNKQNNMNTQTLMAICVGLGLTYRLTEKLFEKSNNKLKPYEDPDMTYIRILETFPKISINDFNSLLNVKGIKELGTEMRD